MEVLLLPWQSRIAMFATCVVAGVAAIVYFLLSTKDPSARAAPQSDRLHSVQRAREGVARGRAQELVAAKRRLETVQRLYAEAEEHLKQKDMVQAKRKCDEALRLSGGNSEYRSASSG